MSDSRTNNFNLIRLLAAATVVFSHSWPIARGQLDAEPLLISNFSFFGEQIRYTAGLCAVQIFFIISGFLVTKSFVSNSSFIRFISARALRIFPALIVSNIFCALIIGSFFHAQDIGAFLKSSLPWSFILHNSTMLTIVQYRLAGVFESNLFPGIVNGSLWSLPHELACYAWVLVLGVSRVYANGATRFVLVAACVLFTTYVWEDLFLDAVSLTALTPSYTRFLFFSFVIGQALFLSIPMQRMPLLFSVSLLCLIFAAYLSWTSVIFNIALGIAVISFAYVHTRWTHFFSRLPDVSYGVYLFGFPVQQSISAFTPGLHPLVLFMWAMIGAVLLAGLSWKFIEAPALSIVHRLSVRAPS